MTDHPTTLEGYALKGMHLAKMTGVSVAVHAIPDAFLLMHTGVGCKYKTAAQVANHDWGTHPNKREAWTQVAEMQLIKGCSTRIGPFARSWYERRRPNFMAVVSAYFIELTGEDFSDAVVEAEATLPCAMALVGTSAPNKGFYDGYASLMLEVVKRLDWKAPPVRAKEAAVLGFFFHRYESDQKGDLGQLRTLCKAAGLTLGPVLFSGRPHAELEKAPEAAFVLQLPYARPKEKKFKRLLKRRQVVHLDLPMGVAGTSRFLRTLAEASGADMRRVETYIAGQEKAILGQLLKISERFRNVEVAVFADTPLAAGLVSLLHEMGIRVPMVGLRDTAGCLGGIRAFQETLGRDGVPFDGMEILEEPSLRLIRERLHQRLGEGRLSGVIGSSHELNVLTHAPRTMALSLNTFLLETGFPSDSHHVTYGIPSLGYMGAVAWAQRVLDGLRSPRVAAEARRI